VQEFYIIIKKESLLVYEKKGNGYERIYLGGNPEYLYSLNNPSKSIEKFLALITEEYNLDSIAEVNFNIIDNEDKIVSNTVLEKFGVYVKTRIHVETLMIEILNSLARDAKLRILEYGINYDNKNYIMKDNGINKGEYSLLAYKLIDDKLIKYVM
jgi:hypothetical protein